MKTWFFYCLSVIFTVLLLSDPSLSKEFKIATLSPEGSMWMRKMREGAHRVREETSGRVTFKFYPGGVMGSDRTVMRKIRMGQLHGGAVTSGSLAKIFPDNQIYGLPMKFRSLAEVDHVRGVMDDHLKRGLSRGGFEVLGMAGGGFAYIMSKYPVVRVEDLQGRKVWVPDNDRGIVASVKAFGVSPMPLSIADVRTGLQTGLIDTVGVSPVGAVTLQWHTQIRHVTHIPLMYIYAILAVDGKSFSQIESSDRSIVKKVMGDVFREIDAGNRVDHAKAIKAMKHVGIKFVKPDASAFKGWVRKAELAEEGLIRSGGINVETVKALEKLLREYRNRNGS